MSDKIKILIIGNGFGGTYALKNLHKLFHGNKNIELSLIGENNYFLFTPLLHEVATGGINPENIIEPIRKILGCCLNNFYLGKASEINLSKKIVKVNKKSISYDYLILAPGAETNFFNTPGAEKYSLTLKSIEDAIKIKNHCINQMEKASHITDSEIRKKMLRFVVVGGGPTGVEFATELHELIKDTFYKYYSKEIVNDTSVVLIQRGQEVLPQFSIKIREKGLEVLQKKEINVMLKTGVTEVSDSYVVLDNNTQIYTDTVVWVAGIKPSNLNFTENISKLPDGKLIVNDFLQLENYKEVYAIGDIAGFGSKENGTLLPALAQVAIKETVSVANNIKLSIKNKKLQPFVYKHSGSMVSLGQWMAVGEISNFAFWGHITWWMWRTVYLSKIISFRKKIKVAMDWTINSFSPRDISKI